MQKTALPAEAICKSMAFCDWSALGSNRYVIKTLLVMKLTIVLLTAVFLNVSAKGVSQTVRFSGTNVPLEKVFFEVEKQTGVVFMYFEPVLKKAKLVSMKAVNIPLEEFIKEIFKDQPLEYTIKGKSIFLSRKLPPVASSKPGSLNNDDLLPPPPVEIKGRVVNDQGNPMAGVSISLKGSSTGTFTGDDGRYSLSIPGELSEKILVFSYVDHQSREIRITTQTTIDITLELTEKALGEIVVIGYGVQRKSDLTGSVVSISKADMQRLPIVNPAMAMQGKAAGVQVMNNSHQPGGAVSVTIRGNSSINAGNEPLYVVDGFPLQGGLTYINPADIVSMEILKDASATAIYGSRGANGVVLIQTINGRKGDLRVSFRTEEKLNKVQRKIPVLNASEFRMLYNEAYANQNAMDGGNRPLPYTKDQIDNPEVDIDWQDMAFQTGFGSNNTVQLTGGSERTTYASSLNYKSEEGIFKTSKWDQIGARLNLESKLSNLIKLGTNFSYNRVNNRLVETDHGGNSVPRALLESMPDRPVYNEDGLWSVASNDGYLSPIGLIEGYDQRRITDNFIGSVMLTLQLAKSLSLKSTFNADIRSSRYFRYTKKGANTPGLPGQTGNVLQENVFNWVNENYLSYDKELGNSTINAIAGASWLKNELSNTNLQVAGIPSDAFSINQLQAARQVNFVNSFAEGSALNSFFGRVNYNFKQKYLFTGTFRTDGSSKFGKNNKYGYFPSGAVAWRMSEEPFIQDLNIFSNLKFRVSYGITGNQEIGNYLSLDRLSSTTSFLGDLRVPGIANTQVPNPELKWEKTGQFDVGFDMGFFNERLVVVVDYYQKKTEDLLLNSPIPQTNGFSTMLRNIGSVSNKGVEIAVSSLIVDRKLKWMTNLNAFFNKNEVLSLVNENQDIFLTAFVNPLSIVRVGESLGSFWGLVREGVYQNQTEINDHLANPGTKRPGDLRYKDIDEDGIIDSRDRTILGNNTPRLIYGISNTISYGRWNLYFQVNGVQGVTVMNLNPVVLEDRQTQTNSLKTLLNRWHGEGTSNTVAAVRINSDLNISNRHAEPGSYLRVRNISLGYDLPSSLLRKLNISSATITGTAIDWFTFTRYGGYDPEVANLGTRGHYDQGLDFSGYPSYKSLMVSLMINF